MEVGLDRAELRDEQEMLKRIAVVLLRLAVLAEFLCVLPFPLRALLLPPLRLAEAVARAFATERVGGAVALPPAAIPGADGDGCAEALRLARCLRVLASVFDGLQDFAWRSFLGGSNGRLAQRATAMAWLGYFMKAWREMNFPGAGLIDTS
jgi:hypothetical protein